MPITKLRGRYPIGSKRIPFGCHKGPEHSVDVAVCTVDPGAAQAGNNNGGQGTIVGGAASGAGTGGQCTTQGGGGGATGTGGSGRVLGGSGGSTSGNGGNAFVLGGFSNDGNGGNVVITGQNGAGVTRSGGAVTITAGTGVTTGSGGSIILDAGNSPSGSPGTISISAGDNTAALSGGGSVSISGGSNTNNGAGGIVTIAGGTGSGANAGGAATLQGGNSSGTGVGGDATVIAGTPTNGNGGSASISGSAGVGTDKDGGAAFIIGGAPTGTGTGGAVTLAAGTGANLNFSARSSGNIPFNAAAPNNALVGFTATSIVGALNEVKATVAANGQSKVRQTSTQSIPTAVVTAITFDTVDTNVGANINLGLHPSAFVIASGAGEVWQVSVQINWSTLNAGIYEVSLSLVTSAGATRHGFADPKNVAGGASTFHCSQVNCMFITQAAGDRIELSGYQNSAASQSTQVFTIGEAWAAFATAVRIA